MKARGPIIRKKGAAQASPKGPESGSADPSSVTGAGPEAPASGSVNLTPQPDRCQAFLRNGGLCNKIVVPPRVGADGVGRCQSCNYQYEVTDRARRSLLEPQYQRPVKQPSLADLVARWRPAPWLFVRECLGATPDPWQDVILHAVVGQAADGTPLPADQPFDKIALKACKGPGKTCVEAWLAWWFLLCFEDPKVVATSITGENLRDNLWTEMALWQAKSKILTSAFEWKTERIELRERPETWFMSARTWPKDADKTRQANTLAGIHARHTLLILDESGDIPEGVMAAGLAHHSTADVEGGTEVSGPQVHITLQCGNPTRLDGALGVACTRDRTKWFVYEITGDPKDPDRAPRMSLKWCQEQIDTWGADNPWVQVNVFGKFPPTQDNKLLGPEIVRASMALVLPAAAWRNAQRIAGLDVARSLAADRSVLARRQGPVVFPFRVWRLDDTHQLVSQVAHELSTYRPVVTFVDATGIGGPVADELRALGFNIVMVYFGVPARDRRFADKRTEIWWAMAQEVKGAGGVPFLALPTHPELIGELTGPEIHFNDKGQVKLESKEKMKKRGLNSPDLADSLAVTWAEPIALTAQAVVPVTPGHANTEYDPFAARD